MFRNYLLTALGSIVRHKLYSFINIAGLTVGLTCAIFIILFVRDQLSYDRWIPGTENLYRVEDVPKLPGKPAEQNAKTPFAATQAMLDQIPEVQARTRLARQSKTILVGNRQFPQTVDIVDPNFLQVIRLPLKAGDPAWAFSRPQSAVLSETTARKYFGHQSPIGKTIVMSGQHWLAAFSTERRTREIGLRKTFGADTDDIVWMLLRQFSVPVLIANAIAWPVAWYYLHDWLQGFAYRIPLSPFYFLGAGAIALLIAWATVFVHARHVASANPIHALRYE